jgi:hypothetical protein
VRGTFQPANEEERQNIQAVLAHKVWSLWVDDDTPALAAHGGGKRSEQVVAWMVGDSLMNDSAVLLTRVLQVRDAAVSVNCAVESVTRDVAVTVTNLSQSKEPHSVQVEVAGLARRRGRDSGCVGVTAKVPVDTKCGDVLEVAGCGAVVHLEGVEWHVFETKE